ncbi:ABC transporter ATP-binding protein [Pseudarthrobacter sp. MDT3-26]|uniref:ABC transporter ATP-binding protein n=1 Tax=Pseudarthrobacter raffinosi TaxID=2953651 RepID=UPI00208EB719|nr:MULTISPECIES: ABC transporter ATP-binding protein [unclassified Pseudarthrobacter]MCO4239044.1 ABC transporter ATP-binding protein [Pseudarthrobacter sp. MDT3-28]MCO4262865.1 ABC transporter ATP-binding protein [Pseudarthrobacter sp. MDT3-26]
MTENWDRIGIPAQPESPRQDGISATAVSRSFGQVHAVEHMDFHAPAGKVTALIGPNGAGKTTLLLMLASLLAPDSGTVTVDGLDPQNHRAEVRKRIGWMPDTLGVWESLTAREILTQIARFYRLPKAGIPQRVTEMLDRVRLSDLADQPARVLSRGQQQRLSLARALIHDPSVLLLDEPASGLDPGSRVELRVMLRQLAAEGKSIVVSSHVLSELDEIADAAVFVNRGRTVRHQTTDAAAASGRRYAISATDGAALAAKLTDLGLTFRVEDGRRPAVSLVLLNDDDAARLLRDLVLAGVGVSSFAPASGALEETYMNLEGERR